MIMCPVDETGRNSVRPSMMARTIASGIDIKSSSAVGGPVKDSKKLNDKTSYYNDGSCCKAKKAKTMRLCIQCHDGKSNYQYDQADDHNSIVFLSEGKFIHNQYNSSRESFRYFCTARQVLTTATKIPNASRLASSTRIRCWFSIICNSSILR